MSLPQSRLSLAWVWTEIDCAWRQLGLDNRRSSAKQPVDEFYGYPVWLMNGIFTAADPVSSSDREAIAGYIERLGANSTAGYDWPMP